MRLRLVQPEDAEAIRAIYNFEVTHGTNTFDLVARTLEQQQRWVDRHQGAHPAIVAVERRNPAQTTRAAPGEPSGPKVEDVTRATDHGARATDHGSTPIDARAPRARHEAVLGFAVLSPYRNRPAYATTVEDSVYVHQDHRGRGVGRVLLEEVLRLAGAHGFHAVIARISGGNEASVRLHEACGFQLVGTEREVGRKHGRWLDVVELQRMV